MLNDLIGKHFEYGGRGPDTFDCYGLCIEVYKRLGLNLPEHPTSFGNLEADNETYNSGKIDFIRLEKPEPFCLVSLMIHKPYVSHIGVVLPDCVHFINAFQKRNVCIENLNSPRWKDRIDGFWRYQS